MATPLDLPPYRYQPLNDENLIRVLELLPGEGIGVLECRLVPVKLSDFTVYETLSYVWGDPANPIPIKCDDGQIEIGRSLHAALTQLRRPKEVRIVWADAICINQSDIPERNSQVAKMGRIYWRASNLNIWLGTDESQEAESVFDLLRGAARSIDEIAKTGNGLYFSPKTTLDDILGTDNKLRVDLQKMLSLPWFHRVWIVQESGLSSNAILHWGSATLDRSVLIKLWLFLFINREPLLLNWRLNLTPFYLFMNYHKPLKVDQPGDKLMEYQRFLDCLQLARSLQATDPRDRAYAFFAHPIFEAGKDNPNDFLDESDSCTVSTALGMKPDYHKSLPEIYQELAEKLLSATGNLRLLSSVAHRFKIKTDLPSWVPRWDQGRVPGVTLGLDPPESFHASRGRETPIFKVVRSKIQVQGILIAKIGFITTTMVGGHFLFDPVDVPGEPLTPRNPVEQLFEAAGPYHSKIPSPYEDVIQAFAMTLANGLMNSMPVESASDRLQFDANFSAYRLAKAKQFNAQWTKGDQSGLSALEEKAKGGNPAIIASDMHKACNGKKYFSTLKGHIGLCPALAELDDVVAVLFGTRIPFLLRPAGESGNFKLVGEAYCHGFMRGEVIELLEKGDFHEQAIILC